MLVELIGPAGIGKTSTALKAEAILRNEGFDVLGFDELERLESEIGMRSLEKVDAATRLQVIVGLLLRRPDIVVPILLLSWLYGPEQSTGSRKRRRRRARRALGHVRLALALRTMAAGRIVLLHEGFTQVLWTLLIDSPSLKAKGLIRFVLARYHAAVGQRGVRFVVDDDTVMRRVFERDSKGRFNRDRSDLQRRAFPRWLDHHRTLIAMLPDDLTNAKIDGSSITDRVARELVTAIESSIPVAGRPTIAAVGGVSASSTT